MATFADLKARIATELTRSDIDAGGSLESLLETYIQRACEYYADTKFWFNSILTTATTSPGVATVTIPATVRVVERVSIPAYDDDLEEYTLDALNDYATSGRPRHYSYYNDSLRFFPVPDGAYTLNIYGIAQVDAPTTDSDTSIWTNEAQDLVVANVKVRLLRFPYRDNDGVILALAEESDARTRLERETGRRLKTDLRLPTELGRATYFDPMIS